MLERVCVARVGEHLGFVAVVVDVFDLVLVASSYWMSVSCVSARCHDIRAVAVLVSVLIHALAMMSSYGVLGVFARAYDCCICVITVMRVACWHVVEVLGACAHEYLCVH